MITSVHLFAGAGGGILADLILGHDPILAIDNNANCCNVLRERKEEGWLINLEIFCENIEVFDFSRWYQSVDLIAAGFPCQDISSAGRGKGIKGERSGLIEHVFRAVDTIQPGLVFLENSPYIRTRGRREIIQRIVEKGYSWRDGILSATDVDAAHIRNRWWLLAANDYGMRKLEQERGEFAKRGWNCYSNTNIADIAQERCGQSECKCKIPSGKFEATRNIEKIANTDSKSIRKQSWWGKWKDWTDKVQHRRNDKKAADIVSERLQNARRIKGIFKASLDTIEAVIRYTGAWNWSPVDAGICGVVDGVAYPLDGNPKTKRIMACGNGQVPLQAALAYILLAHKRELKD
jgi:DNA (cytosine-5)-methyltransferase 1